jgi:hypothetical protein
MPLIGDDRRGNASLAPKPDKFGRALASFGFAEATSLVDLGFAP